MMYTTPFDGYSMTGLTQEDNETLIDYICRDLDDVLEVDQFDRVFDVNERYIANIQRVEAGAGIYCTHDF